jgi:hypothetical protein
MQVNALPGQTSGPRRTRPQTPNDLAACPGSVRHGHNHRRRTNLGPSSDSPSDGPRARCPPRPVRHGHNHRRRTNLGPPATQPSPTDNHRALCRLDHRPAKATNCHPDIQTHLGHPPFSPADGLQAHCPQPVHHRRATIRCRHCCHFCRFRQIRGPFPDKTHLSCHDK